MAAYAIWEDYNDKYLLGRKPLIAETDFPYWARQASSYIDSITFDRLSHEDVLEKYNLSVILAVCEIAERLFTPPELSEYKGLKSVAITGHSVTLDEGGQAAVGIDVRAIASRHLASTGLLYRGLP